VPQLAIVRHRANIGDGRAWLRVAARGIFDLVGGRTAVKPVERTL
jgi:hypothetical protein